MHASRSVVHDRVQPASLQSTGMRYGTKLVKFRLEAHLADLLRLMPSPKSKLVDAPRVESRATEISLAARAFCRAAILSAAEEASERVCTFLCRGALLRAVTLWAATLWRALGLIDVLLQICEQSLGHWDKPRQKKCHWPRLSMGWCLTSRGRQLERQSGSAFFSSSGHPTRYYQHGSKGTLNMILDCGIRCHMHTRKSARWQRGTGPVR